MKRFLVLILGCVLMMLPGCGDGEPEVLAVFPLDDMQSVMAAGAAVLDTSTKAEGSGSLRIEADRPVVVKLLEIAEPDIENATLIYEATLKSSNLDNGAYLEMWCVFSGVGEFFSRGLQTPISGDTDWTTMFIPFYLKQGQHPDLIRLNLVVNGPGTVWVDNIRVLKAPLR